MKKEYGFKGLNNKINEHFQLIVEKKIRKNQKTYEKTFYFQRN